MNTEEISALINYACEHNGWGPDDAKLYDVTIVNNRKAVKYIDVSVDTREGLAWRVSFRGVVGGEDKSFRIDSPDDVKQIYKWLDSPCR